MDGKVPNIRKKPTNFLISQRNSEPSPSTQNEQTAPLLDSARTNFNMASVDNCSEAISYLPPPYNDTRQDYYGEPPSYEEAVRENVSIVDECTPFFSTEMSRDQHNTNFNKNTPVELFRRKEFRSILQEIISIREIDKLTNQEKFNALLWKIIDKKDCKLITLLLKLNNSFQPSLKLNIEAVNNTCCTALMHAIKTSNNDIVEKLIHFGADLTKQDTNGNTALIVAVNNNNFESVKKIVDFLNDEQASAVTTNCLDIKNNNGDTALILAIKNDQLKRSEYVAPKVLKKTTEEANKIALYIIKNSKANLNILNNDGYTALSLSVTNKNYSDRINSEIITALIIEDADILVESDRQSIALGILCDIINKCENSVIEVLIEHAYKNIENDLIYKILKVSLLSGRYEFAKKIVSMPDIDLNKKEKPILLDVIKYVSQLKPLMQVMKHGKADINIRDEDGNTALLLIYRLFDESSYQLKDLLEAGADINIQNNNGLTILMLVVQSSLSSNDYKVSLVTKLLQEGAHINIQDKDGNTALMLAIKAGNKEVINKLIKAGADLNIINNNKTTALMLAIMENNNDLAKELIQKGVHINIQDKDGNTALMLAIKAGNKEVIYELIKAGADLNITNNNNVTALMLAIMENNNDLAKELIQAGAHINMQDVNGNTALIMAIIRGNKEIIDELIKAEADLNLKKQYGYTALMLAIRKGDNETVEKLIRLNADLNLKNNDGYTALIIGIIEGKNESIKTLIRAGVDINIQGIYENTPLTLAIRKGNKEIVKTLIKYRVDVNKILEGSKRTPLMLAIDVQDKEIISLLLDNGSRVDKNILFQAKKTKNEDIINLVKKALPKKNWRCF